MARAAAIAVCSLPVAAIGPCSGEELSVDWTDSAGRSLDLIYSMRGGQELGSVDVDEEDDRVTVLVRAKGCFGNCGYNDEQILGCVTVTLDEPLGSRELIDGSTDRPPQPDPPGSARPPGEVPCEPPP